MTKRLILALVMLWFAGAAREVRAGDDYDDAILKGKQLAQQGVTKFDEKTLLDARAIFERLTDSEKMGWLADYYIGYVDYRLATLYTAQGDREKQIKYLDDAVTHINKSLDKNEEFAGSYGLLSALLGQQIGIDPASTMTLGMQAITALNDALELGKENPRVAVFSGLSSFYTPEQYGGSKTRAVAEMERAIALFKTEEIEDKRLPDWGHTEAYVWLGRFHTAAKEFDSAKRSLEKALEMSSESSFAKLSMQQLEQSLSNK